MKKIDAYQGNLSRAKFIDFAVDRAIHEAWKEVKTNRKVSLMNKWGTEKVNLQEKYITQKELDEFMLNIKGIIKAFIEFFITYDMELNVRPKTAVRKLIETVDTKPSRSMK